MPSLLGELLDEGGTTGTRAGEHAAEVGWVIELRKRAALCFASSDIASSSSMLACKLQLSGAGRRGLCRAAGGGETGVRAHTRQIQHTRVLQRGQIVKRVPGFVFPVSQLLTFSEEAVTFSE